MKEGSGSSSGSSKASHWWSSVIQIWSQEQRPSKLWRQSVARHFSSCVVISSSGGISAGLLLGGIDVALYKVNDVALMLYGVAQDGAGVCSSGGAPVVLEVD